MSLTVCKPLSSSIIRSLAPHLPSRADKCKVTVFDQPTMSNRFNEHLSADEKMQVEAEPDQLPVQYRHQIQVSASLHTDPSVVPADYEQSSSALDLFSAIPFVPLDEVLQLADHQQLNLVTPSTPLVLSLLATDVEQNSDQSDCTKERHNTRLEVAQWTDPETKVRVILKPYSVVVEIPNVSALPENHWCHQVAEQWKAIYDGWKDKYGHTCRGYPTFKILKCDEAHPGKALFFGHGAKKYHVAMFQECGQLRAQLLKETEC